MVTISYKKILSEKVKNQHSLDGRTDFLEKKYRIAMLSK